MATTPETRRFPALIALLLLVTGCALAAPGSKEDRYGVIAGTVYAPDSRPAYGVKVKVRRAEDKKARWELVSDHHGEFALRVPPAAEDYFVWAEIKEKKPATPEVKVHIDGEIRMDISLHLTEGPPAR